MNTSTQPQAATTDSIFDSRIRDMCMVHFNEPILTDYGVVRLIGYGETAVDCYLLCRKTRSDRARKLGDVIWHTAVGGYYFLDRLKGQGYVESREGEDWDDFKRLDDRLGRNGAPKEGQFMVDLQPNELEGMTPPAEIQAD